MLCIQVKRDSVCAGDDAFAPHEYNFEIIESSALIDIFVHLKHRHYLPYVSGKGHCWDAVINGSKVADIKANHGQPEPNSLLETPTLNFVHKGRIELHFIYHSAEF